MIQRLLVACALGAMTLGSVALATPPGGNGGGNGNGGGPGGGIDCTQYCPPIIELPEGGFCELDGCLVVEDAAFCEYSCYYPLPF